MALSRKRVLHWIGSSLAVIGIAFVAFRINDYSAEIDLSRFDAMAWAVVLVLAFSYGFANIFLAFAWRNLLQLFGVNTPKLLAVQIYGITQLAKYVPGNIFHLAGRQAMGLAAGIPGWPIAKASLWELIFISIAGVLFGILVLPLYIKAMSVPWATAVFLCVVLTVTVGIQKHVSKESARAMGWYILFLFISGMVFTSVLMMLTTERFFAPSQMLTICGAYILAWLAGLVTPGAPAGVGVRELVLFFLLNSFVIEGDLLLAILIGRLVTVGGDLLFYLGAIIIPDRLTKINDTIKG
jgi:uncharacterized membrane protein YbhN (UPF0104 family)